MKLTDEQIRLWKKAYKNARLCGMGFAFREELRKADIEPCDYEKITGEKF